MQDAAGAFGKIDILVNNAGITRDAMVHRMTDEQFNAVFDVIVRGTFNCVRAASPYLRDAAKKDKEQGKRVHRKVINVSSIAGIYGTVGNTSYSAAKAAIIGFTKALAREWAMYYINVNAVAPGFVETRLTAERTGDAPYGVPPQVRDGIISRIPIGRPGQPEDIAAAISFLASDDANFITGQVLQIDGGLEIIDVIGQPVSQVG